MTQSRRDAAHWRRPGQQLSFPRSSSGLLVAEPLARRSVLAGASRFSQALQRPTGRAETGRISHRAQSGCGAEVTGSCRPGATPPSHSSDATRPGTPWRPPCPAPAGKRAGVINTGQMTTMGLGFSPDSKYLASFGARGRNVSIWRVPSAADQTPVAPRGRAK
jgi:hypothetical protein